MQSRYKRYFVTTIGFFIGNVFTKMISFILLPLYTSLIDPEIYGIYGVNMTISQLVVYTVYFTVWDAMFRFAADAETQDGKYEIISNGLPIMGISTIICSLVLLGINMVWELHNPYLVCAYGAMNAFQYYYGYISRSMHDNKVFIISGCINSFINLSLNWIGIAYLHHGIEVLYYSYIIGTAVQIIIIELKFRVMRHFKISYLKKNILWTLLRFGGPLSLNSAAQWLLTGCTQMMIAYKLGTYYNGLFSVSIKFATFISLIVSVFQFAWYELAYELAKEERSSSYYNRTINMLFGVLVLSASSLILMIKIIYPYYIAEAYWASLEIIPYIVVYACANAYAGFLGTIYLAYKDVDILTVSSLVSGGVNFILLLVLIPCAGLHGAVAALTIASILMMFIRSFVLHKKYEVSLNLGTFLYVIPLLCCCFIFYTVDSIGLEIVAILICILFLLLATRSLYIKYLRGGVQQLRKIAGRLIAFILVVAIGRPKNARFTNAKESIDILAHSDKSLIRFGDGEFMIMNNHGIHYQDSDERLARELKEIILEYDATESSYYLAMPSRHFTCPWTFYVRHWEKMKWFLYSRRTFVAKYDFDQLFFDAFMFSKTYAQEYPQIWQGEDLKGLILVHNDPVYAKVLNESSGVPVEVVVIPASNAYSIIEELIENVMKLYSPGKLILISAGPCGKAMVYRLSKMGIRSIDTGHCFDDPLEVV